MEIRDVPPLRLTAKFEYRGTAIARPPGGRTRGLVTSSPVPGIETDFRDGETGPMSIDENCIDSFTHSFFTGKSQGNLGLVRPSNAARPGRSSDGGAREQEARGC